MQGSRRTAPDDPEFLNHLDAQIAVNLGGASNMTIALPRTRCGAQRTRRQCRLDCFLRRLSEFSQLRRRQGAVIQLTKALAADLAADGVRVSGISPGVIATAYDRRDAR